jgi:hypothetical protein
MERINELYYHALLPATRKPLWAKKNELGAMSVNGDRISEEYRGAFSYYVSVLLGGIACAVIGYLLIFAAIMALN